MRIITKSIPVCADDPIELRGVNMCTHSSVFKYHRIEYRLREEYFQEYYANKVFPEGDGWCEEEYTGLFGIKRTRKVKVVYTNPWRYIDFGLAEKYGYTGYDFLVMDKREDFDKLKSTISTFAEFEQVCKVDKAKKEKTLQLKARRIAEEWY